MAAALFFKQGLGFVFTLSVDCCVHGASRWAVREGLADIEVSRKEMRVYAKLGRVFLAE